MNHLPSLDNVNYTLAVVGTMAILVGWYRGWWESPKRRQERERRELAQAQATAVAEAILGEPEELDRSGKVLTPARPGLVSRTATLEQAVSTLIDQDARIKRVEDVVESHGEHINFLRAASEERAATASASAEMLKMVRDRDVIDSDEA